MYAYTNINLEVIYSIIKSEKDEEWMHEEDHHAVYHLVFTDALTCM